MKQRFWEIDFTRGIAIIMMIIYHELWNMIYIFNLKINLSDPFWRLFQITTASLFLLLVGISLSISNTNSNANLQKYLKRGIIIISYGMIVGIIAGMAIPNSNIFFGILHLIGTSIIISYFFRKHTYASLISGIGILLLPLFIKENYTQNIILIILGISKSAIKTYDLFPIIPWLGIVLIGLFFGRILYSDNKRQFRIIQIEENSIIKIICYLGKHSLIIYLLHQVILFGLTYIIGIYLI